jgi:hypothetical protein
MQSTGLNIIAIAIFTITLSVLLGPVFNISPLIPALTTFAVMGLVTVDTLAYENKGINLLLDLFASSQQRERIIYHEAGHFLVATLLQIPIVSYNLTAWENLQEKQSGLGGVVFDFSCWEKKTTKLTEFNLNLERFCIVLMSGIAAESLIYQDVQGGKEDYQQLKTTLSSLGLSDNLYQQKQRWALLQATNLIKENLSSYEELVKAMKAKKSIEECQRIIRAC